ncbi:uncharacterized protein LOC129744320 [Uranotaenia lowii]|uniref:uncharacterized protein LOC129744320 n=1 Tax=Uranotaenia lowii TaxID=190385 RepID=UPI00247A80F6|nr:uncharacterized protein LOC129744320 [Uranotaenia lowii]
MPLRLLADFRRLILRILWWPFGRTSGGCFSGLKLSCLKRNFDWFLWFQGRKQSERQNWKQGLVKTPSIMLLWMRGKLDMALQFLNYLPFTGKLQDHGRRIDFQVPRTWRKLRKVTPPQIPRSYFFGPIFNGNHQSDQPAAGVAFGSLLTGPRRMRNFVNDIKTLLSYSEPVFNVFVNKKEFKN